MLILQNTTVPRSIKTNRSLFKPTKWQETQEKGKIPHAFGKRTTKQVIISCTHAQKWHSHKKSEWKSSMKQAWRLQNRPAPRRDRFSALSRTADWLWANGLASQHVICKTGWMPPFYHDGKPNTDHRGTWFYRKDKRALPSNLQKRITCLPV